MEGNTNGETRKQFVETATTILNKDKGATSIETQIVMAEALSDLVDGLAHGNIAAVDSALERLGLQRDNNLYTTIGQMARGLHDSLREFKAHLDKANLTMHTTNIPDAADKLEQVIQMCFDAANRTMNIAEAQIRQTSQRRKEAQSLFGIIEAEGLTDSPVGQAVIEFLKQDEQHNKESDNAFNEIIMTQEFQDLSGQALRKVVKLVTDIENKLLNLLELFGGHHEETVPDEASCQQPEAEMSSGPIGQDDADELKSLGF